MQDAVLFQQGAVKRAVTDPDPLKEGHRVMFHPDHPDAPGAVLRLQEKITTNETALVVLRGGYLRGTVRRQKAEVSHES